VEGVFEEVRRVVEGRRWGRIEAKQAAVEAILERLQAEGRSRRLARREDLLSISYRLLANKP